jgi:hypothetical protein
MLDPDSSSSALSDSAGCSTFSAGGSSARAGRVKNTCGLSKNIQRARSKTKNVLHHINVLALKIIVALT